MFTIKDGQYQSHDTIDHFILNLWCPSAQRAILSPNHPRLISIQSYQFTRGGDMPCEISPQSREQLSVDVADGDDLSPRVGPEVSQVPPLCHPTPITPTRKRSVASPESPPCRRTGPAAIELIIISDRCSRRARPYPFRPCRLLHKGSQAGDESPPSQDSRTTGRHECRWPKRRDCSHLCRCCGYSCVPKRTRAYQKDACSGEFVGEF